MRLIIRVDQRHYFNEEIMCLKRKKPVQITSQLATLTPFMDMYGIFRVGERLQHSSLPEDVKNPIILSQDGQLAVMLISDIHRLNIHSFTACTVSRSSSPSYNQQGHPEVLHL